MHSGSCLCRWALPPLHEASFLTPIRMRLVRSQLTSSITTPTEKESYGQAAPESCTLFMHWSGNSGLMDLEHSRWFLGTNLTGYPALPPKTAFFTDLNGLLILTLLLSVFAINQCTRADYSTDNFLSDLSFFLFSWTSLVVSAFSQRDHLFCFGLVLYVRKVRVKNDIS